MRPHTLTTRPKSFNDRYKVQHAQYLGGIRNESEEKRQLQYQKRKLGKLIQTANNKSALREAFWQSGYHRVRIS